MRRPDARFALWGVALSSLICLPLFAGFAGAAWELAQIAGLAGALGCVALCGAPLRPREARPPSLITLRLHTFLGWAALAAVLLHAAGLLIADRQVIEYLKPTSPLHQLAGIAAALLLIVLVMSSSAGARRRLWSSHRGFQATHVVLGCLVVALGSAHVIATRRYIGAWPQRLLWIAAAAGALLMLLRFRRRSSAELPAPSVRSPRLVFGRHSTLVLAVVAAAAVFVAGLSLSAAARVSRLPLLARHAAMPLDFPHSKHVAINCLECHHNYEEGDFSNTCIACHRSSRTDLRMPAEPRFHGYCLDCHRHPDVHRRAGMEFERHGPVAGCTVCHDKPGVAMR